jgi:hypothetical protein
MAQRGGIKEPSKPVEKWSPYALFSLLSSRKAEIQPGELLEAVTLFILNPNALDVQTSHPFLEVFIRLFPRGVIDIVFEYFNFSPAALAQHYFQPSDHKIAEIQFSTLKQHIRKQQEELHQSPQRLELEKKKAQFEKKYPHFANQLQQVRNKKRHYKKICAFIEMKRSGEIVHFVKSDIFLKHLNSGFTKIPLPCHGGSQMYDCLPASSLDLNESKALLTKGITVMCSEGRAGFTVAQFRNQKQVFDINHSTGKVKFGEDLWTPFLITDLSAQDYKEYKKAHEKFSPPVVGLDKLSLCAELKDSGKASVFSSGDPKVQAMINHTHNNCLPQPRRYQLDKNQVIIVYSDMGSVEEDEYLDTLVMDEECHYSCYHSETFSDGTVSHSSDILAEDLRHQFLLVEPGETNRYVIASNYLKQLGANPSSMKIFVVDYEDDKELAEWKTKVANSSKAEYPLEILWELQEKHFLLDTLSSAQYAETGTHALVPWFVEKGNIVNVWGLQLRCPFSAPKSDDHILRDCDNDESKAIAEKKVEVQKFNDRLTLLRDFLCANKRNFVKTAARPLNKTLENSLELKNHLTSCCSAASQLLQQPENKALELKYQNADKALGDFPRFKIVPKEFYKDFCEMLGLKYTPENVEFIKYLECCYDLDEINHGLRIRAFQEKIISGVKFTLFANNAVPGGDVVLQLETAFHDDVVGMRRCRYLKH